MNAVEFDNVSIVFGDAPQEALPLMDKGMERGEIQSETGQVLGVHNCRLDVREGEILVLMGSTRWCAARCGCAAARTWWMSPMRMPRRCARYG